MCATTLKDLVRRFCIRKLAQTLWECVEHPGNRAEADWYTAEQFIDSNGHIIDLAMLTAYSMVIQNLSTCEINENADRSELVIPLDFPIFEQLCGRLIWELGYQRITRSLPPGYGHIYFH